MIAAGSSDSITAVELFNGIFNASLAVMLITLIASLGMTFSLGQILEPTIVPFAIAAEVGRVISRPAASNTSAIPADTNRDGERHA